MCGVRYVTFGYVSFRLWDKKKGKRKDRHTRGIPMKNSGVVFCLLCFPLSLSLSLSFNTVDIAASCLLFQRPEDLVDLFYIF